MMKRRLDAVDPVMKKICLLACIAQEKKHKPTVLILGNELNTHMYGINRKGFFSLHHGLVGDKLALFTFNLPLYDYLQPCTRINGWSLKVLCFLFRTGSS